MQESVRQSFSSEFASASIKLLRQATHSSLSDQGAHLLSCTNFELVDDSSEVSLQKPPEAANACENSTEMSERLHALSAPDVGGGIESAKWEEQLGSALYALLNEHADDIAASNGDSEPFMIG